MSRYRLAPSAEQEVVLRQHCAHARFVWNLAVEQQSWYGAAGRGTAPGWVVQARQLTEARAEHDWLAAGSQMVQQQALRDFGHSMANFFAGTHRKPTWRRAGRDEGFRIVAVKPGHVRRLNRNAAQVWVPKAGWVRFRLSRPVPDGESQAVFRCRACGYCGNADTNAAMNIAAGHAVTARGRSPLGGRLNREPQLALLAS